MNGLFRFAAAKKQDPAVVAWLHSRGGEVGNLARLWFEVLRQSGADVQEVLHDGHPTACVGDAAFAYVAAFRTHVNVGFYRGAELPDLAGLLEGSGKFMRHVKLKPDREGHDQALTTLIKAAYADMKSRLAGD